MVDDDVFFCRHGQTDYNAEGRFQGRRDIPLNDFGRWQAKRNGTYLRRSLGDGAADFTFLASPLGRAQETMKIIRSELRLDPACFETDERLVEVGYGDWEGRTLDEISETDPQAYEAREADKWNYLCSGENSESYAMLLERIEPLLESVTPKTIVVSHGGVSRALLRKFARHSDQDAATTEIPQDRILTFDRYGPRWL